MKGVCVNIQMFRCHNSDESVVYTESIPAMLGISLSTSRANSLTGTKKEYFAASMNIYRALVHMESPVQIDFERQPE